jgi:predicted dehydrogenase
MPNRRTVLKAIAGGSLLTAASARRVRGANHRVRVGFIGVGLIGKRHLLDFQAQPDVEVAAICEVYDPRLDEGLATAGNGAARIKDFRRMLDLRDLDAVVVSTPDHWHALMTILACAAGKDVYVEKPLTHALREGEWMMAAAGRYGRVVQVGTQQRSGRHYQRAVALVQDGHIGDVRGAQMAAYRNIMPGFTRPVGERPLDAADWDMWLGPAPFVPFDPMRCIYHFRWFWDYSGGQTTNLLSHEIDILQWAAKAMPKSVAAMAKRASLTGAGETPDLFEAIFEYPGFLATWSSREVSAGGHGGLEIYGTRGTLAIDRRGFEIIPDRDVPPEDQIPRFTEARPTGPNPPRLRTEPVKEGGFEQVRDQFVPHVRNFLDCVKSRQQPISDLESGQRTSVGCHLANIAMRVGRVVHWDDVRQEIVGDAEASALLTNKYRAPWDRELSAALPGARA